MVDQHPPSSSPSPVRGRHGKAIGIGAFLLLVFLSGLGMAKAEPPTEPPASESSVVQEHELEEATRTIEESLRQELSHERDAIEKLRTQVYQSNDRVLMIVQTVVTVAAFVIALLGAVAFWEMIKINRTRREAEDMLQRAAESVQEAEDASAYLKSMRQRFVSSKDLISKIFAELPPGFERTWIVGTKRRKVDPDQHAMLEDIDRTIVIGDRLGLISDEKNTVVNQKIARSLALLANYWKMNGTYAKAAARARRAIELHPSSYGAHLELGSILAERAAVEKMTDDRKSKMLAEALASIKRAQRINRRHTAKTAYAVAWIQDELGDYAHAIQQYRRARRLDVKAAEEKGREPDLMISYDLACSLAKKGDFDRALDELEGVGEEARKHAVTDQDFRRLRESTRHAERLYDLIGAGPETVSQSDPAASPPKLGAD